MPIDFNQPILKARPEGKEKTLLQEALQLKERQQKAGLPISAKSLIDARYGRHSAWDFMGNFFGSLFPTTDHYKDYKEKIQRPYLSKGKPQLNQNVDLGSQAQNINTYLPGVREPEHAAKYIFADPKTGKIDSLTGQLTPEKSIQIKQRYAQWAKRYKYYGGQPSVAKWLSMHTPDKSRTQQQKALIQSDKERKVGRGFQLFFQNYGNAHKVMYPGLTSKEGKEAVQAAEAFQRGIDQYKKLPTDQKISYIATGLSPAAIGAGGYLAAPYAVPAASFTLKNLVAPSIGYSLGDKVTQPFIDMYNKDLRAVGDAIVARDLSGLTKPQLQIVNKLRQKFTLGQDVRGAGWDAAAKSLYAQAGQNQRIAKSMVATGLSLFPTGKGYSFFRALPGAGLTGLRTYMNSQESTTPAQDVLYGNVPQQQRQLVQQIAQQNKMPVTRNLQIAARNAVRTKEEQQGLWQQLVSKVTGSKSGQDFTHSRVQNSIQQLVDFGNMDAEQQKKALPGLLRNMKNLASSPMKLNALTAYLSNKDNMQRLVKTFDKYGPQELSALYDAVDQIGKQNKGLVPPQVKQLQDTLEKAAQDSVLPKYRAVLSESDPQKFYAGMQQWMTLFYKFSKGNKGGAQQFKELRDQTQKAIWAHVKRNPLFINKAMSLWALSNGYASLGSFLGSNGAFYGTLVGLPLTIALMSSLFGGGKQVPAQAPQQAPQQYQPMAYAPRGITERGLIVG